MYTLNSTEVHGVCYGLDLQGGKGNASYTIDVAPTILFDSHGTPNAVSYKPLEGGHTGCVKTREVKSV